MSTISLNINGQVYKDLSLAKLKPVYQCGLGFELAKEKTDDNTIDEIFFEFNNEKYIAYKDDLALENMPKNPKVSIVGVDAKINFSEIKNEANAQSERIKLVKFGSAAKQAVKTSFGGAISFMAAHFATVAFKDGLKFAVTKFDTKTALTTLAIGAAAGLAWGFGERVYDDIKGQKPENTKIDEISDPVDISVFKNSGNRNLPKDFANNNNEKPVINQTKTSMATSKPDSVAESLKLKLN